jgi:type I restriction enzyme S subunit
MRAMHTLAREKFKNTPVGKIPADWQCVPLANLVAKPQYGTSAALNGAGRHRVLRMNNIQEGRVTNFNVASANLTDNEAHSLELHRGDILVNRTNSYDLVGKCGIFALSGYYAFASYLVRLSPKREIVVPEFLNHFLQSPAGQKVIKQLRSKGVSQSNINPSALVATLHVALPDKKEQRAIADRLDQWDLAILGLDQLIEARAEQKRGLMQQLFTGKRSFTKGISWVHVQLGDVFKERVETGYSKLPLLAITSEKGIVPRDELAKRDSSNPDKSKYLRIAPGDIGYNTMRMWQGVSALSAFEGIVSPAYTVVTPTERVDGRFASYLFKFPPTIHLFWRYSQGIVDDTLNLKFDAFSKIRLQIPDSIREQQRIALILKTCDDEIALLEEQAEALREQKRGLMQKLLTGQVRLRPAAA